MKILFLLVVLLLFIGCSNNREIIKKQESVIQPTIPVIVKQPTIVNPIVIQEPKQTVQKNTIEKQTEPQPIIVENNNVFLPSKIIKIKKAVKAKSIIFKPKTKDGVISYTIPDKMFVGKEETISVKVGAGLTAIQIKEIKEKVKEKIKTSMLMSITLISVDEAFKIVELSSKDQIIIFDGFQTIWNWSVTPIKPGNHKLILQATARHEIGNLVEKLDYPIYNKEVKIETNFITQTKGLLTKWQKELVGAILGTGVMGVIGAKLFKTKEKENTDEA